MSVVGLKLQWFYLTASVLIVQGAKISEKKPLHNIYEKELCISPIPSLAIHCTNVNSIFGLSPNVD